MRRLRYGVAASLDGFIATEDGGYDWIVQDATIDFAALFSQFDAAVMGRGTFETLLAQGSDGTLHGLDVVVFSRTLRAADHPKVRVTAEDPARVVEALKAESGKDIWLFGGGKLFRSLLDAGVVDAVDVAVIPILLGGGIPLLAAGTRSPVLRLKETKTYPSGIVSLSYDVDAVNRQE